MFNTTEKPNTKGSPLKLGLIIIAAIVVPIVLGILFVGGENDTPQTTPTVQANTPQEVSDVGTDGYLRLVNNPDPSQKIILTDTKEEFEQVTKALLANDMLGLLEIPGAFNVSVGTKVKVIESSFGLRRVRILEAVEQDRVGRAGWVAKEWVIDK